MFIPWLGSGTKLTWLGFGKHRVLAGYCPDSLGFISKNFLSPQCWKSVSAWGHWLASLVAPPPSPPPPDMKVCSLIRIMKVTRKNVKVSVVCRNYKRRHLFLASAVQWPRVTSHLRNDSTHICEMVTVSEQTYMLIDFSQTVKDRRQKSKLSKSISLISDSTNTDPDGAASCRTSWSA